MNEKQLLFSERKKIEEKYLQWKSDMIERTGYIIHDCASNFIVFLQKAGYLNVNNILAKLDAADRGKDD